MMTKPKAIDADRLGIEEGTLQWIFLGGGNRIDLMGKQRLEEWEQDNQVRKEGRGDWGRTWLEGRIEERFKHGTETYCSGNLLKYINTTTWMKSPNNGGDRTPTGHFFSITEAFSAGVGFHPIEFLARGVLWKSPNNPGCWQFSRLFSIASPNCWRQHLHNSLNMNMVQEDTLPVAKRKI